MAQASELRQMDYVFKDSAGSWKAQVAHVICDDCPPLKKLAWSPADFAERVVRIRAPLSVPKGNSSRMSSAGKHTSVSDVAEKRPSVVYFDFDSSRLKKQGLKKLREYVHGINNSTKGGTIEITGYTDGVGTKEYNDGLAFRRAEAVYRALRAMGLPGDIMKVMGRGRCCYADSDVRSGKNRRVEVIDHRKD